MLNHAGASRPGGRRAASRLLAYSILASTSLLSLSAERASAQVAPAPAVRQSIDGNGVDLFWGTMSVDGPAVAAGQGGNESLVWRKFNRGGGWGDTVLATLTVSGSTVYVSFGGTSDRFTISGSSYLPTEGNGSTLSLSGNVYTYTSADGTVAHFSKTITGTYPYNNVTGLVTDITRPSGASRSFTFETLNVCIRSKPGGLGYICTQHGDISRIASVTNNAGYTLTFAYPHDAAYYLDPDFVPYEPYESFWEEWGNITGVSGSGGSQAFGLDPTPGPAYYNINDNLGRTTKYRMSGGSVLGITRPGSVSEDVTVGYTFSPAVRVTSITTPVGTTNYSAVDGALLRTVTVTDPDGHASVYEFEITSQRMKSATDPLGRETQWEYDPSGRVTRVTAPEGDHTEYGYDLRGNVTLATKVAKSGSGVSDIVTSAAYDPTCVNPVTCNQPNSTTDALGNVTDYSYDPTTGQPLTVALPPAATSGIRPTTTYSYTTVSGMELVTGVSACQTTASCVGTADEVKSTIAYNANGLPSSVTRGAGDGSLTATTAMTYSTAGDTLTVDGPLSGSADTMRYRYDGARRMVGVTSPDPDGAGARKPRAQRLTYDVKDRVTLAETGNVDSQSDVDWAAFTSAQQVATDYDDADRAVKRTVAAGGTPYGVTQYSYDVDGRLDCTALRMNDATWSALPAACTLATPGSDGPDRITRTSYDDAEQVTRVQSAYGTADQADETILTYTANGRLATATDAEGNTTTYEYDGVDRLLKTRYPDTIQGAGTSSTTDYEALTYDAGSNVTARRLRDGTSIGYGYDDLGRLTAKTTPGSVYADWDMTYGYDLLGRVTGAVGDGTATRTFGYDALGRMTIEANTSATTWHAYDLAGRQTRLTWDDSFYVDYDHAVTGEVTAIRENGATSGIGVLATYEYDDLGRRTGITRGNGTTTSYTYDAVSRLASLSEDMSGSGYDFTHGFTYNPAGQIASASRSNDAYAWLGHANADNAYANNGLNQATIAGATNLGYDARGNLTSLGGTNQGYTSENRMTGISTVAVSYEPGGDQLLRLYNSATHADTRFAWSGSQMIAEIDASTSAIARRYVPGPGVDETVAWYEGAGTSDRRWLHADERGSVVAISDASGAVTNVNSYDEYGIPGAGNVGRFQYTGQAWLPELGMYYYKARMYAPTLGRFMQTDPIGYGDGMNAYNYVGGDPVNGTDPSGLSLGTPGECGGPGQRACGPVIGGRDNGKTGPFIWSSNPHDCDNGCNVYRNGRIRWEPAPPKGNLAGVAFTTISPSAQNLLDGGGGGGPQNQNQETAAERQARLAALEKVRALHNARCAAAQIDAFKDNLGWVPVSSITVAGAQAGFGEMTLSTAVRAGFTRASLFAGVGLAWAQAVWSTRNC